MLFSSSDTHILRVENDFFQGRIFKNSKTDRAEQLKKRKPAESAIDCAAKYLPLLVWTVSVIIIILVGYAFLYWYCFHSRPWTKSGIFLVQSPD